MTYTLLYDNPEESLIQRILSIRNVTDHHDTFLEPTYASYWQDWKELQDIDKGLARIQQAIQNNEKIMIFGDYDVDGIMSSYVMYTFFRKYLWYHNISVRLPHRVNDGYGIKSYHIDEIKADGCDLIITVDNGITSVKEMEHAKKIWLDVIITDHHQPLDVIPECVAVINPQCWPTPSFKEICGATVALKVCCGLADSMNLDWTAKKSLLNEFLPFVAMATVADCMPLINENRLLVKKWLHIMNEQRNTLAPWLRLLLEHLNIKKMDTYHIGFMIGPRLNATGRMWDAIEWLKWFLFKDEKKITDQFAIMEQFNIDRKKRQDDMMKIVKEEIDHEKMIIAAAHEEFHEWIVWIVAWRMTEKHNKPSIIMNINKEKWIATWSLRWPHYFNIVEMLKTADHLLERYGWHEQAWWATVPLEKLDEFFEHIYSYCSEIIPTEPPKKILEVDTRIHTHELNAEALLHLAKLGPFGMWNSEPLLLVEEVEISRVETIWKSEKSHLKLHCKKDDVAFTVMQRGKGDKAPEMKDLWVVSIIGKLKEDTFNGGFYIDGKEIIS